MNKEIKFRCWNTTHKEMNSDAYAKLILYKESVGETILDCKVLRFTGLVDKNGVDIYEGDVVNVPYNYIGNILVQFKNGKYNITSYNISAIKVIGNIYQNPDLIK